MHLAGGSDAIARQAKIAASVLSRARMLPGHLALGQRWAALCPRHTPVVAPAPDYLPETMRLGGVKGDRL